MKSTFFARRALLILCIVFFLTPFALRGARMSLQQMTNNVKDWLPPDFPETTELEWFGRHFMGEQFVVVTWPGCSEKDPRFHKMVELLQDEVIPAELLDPEAQSGPTADTSSAPDPNPPAAIVDARKDFAELTPEDRAELDRLRGREIGDALGLCVPPDDHRNWGRRDERWLRGDNDLWYFITPEGELFQWEEKSTLPSYLMRTFKRTFRGQREVMGKQIAVLGDPSTAERPNEFHADPHKLTARLFKSIVTGPETLEQLSTKDGPLWPRGADDDYASQVAHEKALERLTGTLFGPDGEQTCILLTLSDPGKRDLRRVIGRPLLGRPRGRLLELATVQCGIPEEELKLGGPPVDNVAIDEEGQITLARLIGYSVLIGVGLSLVCFRSIKITIMIFFVGGVSAIASLGIVWWSGDTVDAILMSMPSLVYVLGLSGAVHIVNYYRDAVNEHGLEGAPERAIRHGWKPCTLAAFTTALGLLSLNTSNITPIKKFGLFSAIGVMATLILLFTYLPSALQIWPPRQSKRTGAGRPRSNSFDLRDSLISFWEPIGRWIVGRYAAVAIVCFAVFVFFAFGLPRIETNVELIKLFDKDAKIIRDYAWLEDNLGKLVPMELVVRVEPEMIRSSLPVDPDTEQDSFPGESDVEADPRFQLDFLQRMEIAARIQEVVENTFGEQGQGVVGRAMSVPTFAPELPPAEFSGTLRPMRGVMTRQLEKHRHEYLVSDYLRVDREPPYKGSELWRISLRLAALKDVDYGKFVNELKRAVEPVMTAYRARDEILHAIDDSRGDKGFVDSRVAFLGMPEPGTAAARDQAAKEDDDGEAPSAHDVDQTTIFAETLRDLLTCSNIHAGKGSWHSPDAMEAGDDFYTSEPWGKMLEKKFDCVVLLQDHPDYDLDFIRQHARVFIDARDHDFDPFAEEAETAASLRDPIHVVYTGVVPIVYKAQRTLLTSLIDSIGAAFVMIAAVMMVLLRSGPLRLTNLLNVRAGMISMLPNVFPVVLIFGGMGYLGMKVDIGTMMTASVAMGVAVDDTIHFLTWFRDGIQQGKSRNQAIIEAYKRCAAAMTQTTLIGGLGLAVFAFSTFTPTQGFGIMMLTLLAAALIGDLVFLPALLASPMGRWFCPVVSASPAPADPHGTAAGVPTASDGSSGVPVASDGASGFAAPHVGKLSQRTRDGAFVRTDPGHREND